MEPGVDDDTATVLDYLEHLVVAGISDRTARSTDVAGRVVAVLLEALTSAGGADRATGYMAADPGGACRLELTGPGGTSTPVSLDDLFDRLAEGGAGAGTAVVALSDGGLRRRVLEVSDDGATVFVFPEAECLEGPSPAVDDARRRWAWTVSTWSRRSVTGPSPGALDPAGPVAGQSIDPDALAARIVEALPAPEPLDAGAIAERLRHDTAADVADAVRVALSEVALEVDLGAIDVAVADAVTQSLGGREAGERERADQLVERLVEALRPGPIDVVRLADLIGERMPAAATPVTDGEAEVRRLAAQVVDTLRPFLEAVGSSGQGTAIAEASLVSASEQLQLQLQAFADRIAAGTRSLTALADEMAAATRDANDYADRLAQSLTASVDRLGRQIDRRLNELQRGDNGGRRTRPGATVRTGGDAGGAPLPPR
jgi:hypothetical protein